jgi:hypothetical protein
MRGPGFALSPPVKNGSILNGRSTHLAARGARCVVIIWLRSEAGLPGPARQDDLARAAIRHPRVGEFEYAGCSVSPFAVIVKSTVNGLTISNMLSSHGASACLCHADEGTRTSEPSPSTFT